MNFLDMHAHPHPLYAATPRSTSLYAAFHQQINKLAQ